MPGRGPGPGGTERGSSEARAEGGGGGSAGHSYYQKSKGPDRIKEGHKVGSHVAKLQGLWTSPQNQTIFIPKSVLEAALLKHAELVIGRRRHLRGLAGVHSASCLRALLKPQYLLVIRGRPGAAGTSRSPSDAAPATEAAAQHAPRRPETSAGFKTGYVCKIRCKSLKIFRRPSRLFMQPVSSNHSESYVREKKEEDLLNTCMQSLSIGEQGERLMLT